MRFTIVGLCSYSLKEPARIATNTHKLPALQRRRLSSLGKAAFDAADQVSDAGVPASPLVFASRHGDMDRSIALLSQLSHTEGLSPTQFGLSVHNAIGAFFSIAHHHLGNYTAIAAGSETTAAAFSEALALLATGEKEVRIVCYDAPLPAPYDSFAIENTPLHAWACVITASNGAGFSLQAAPATSLCPAQSDSLPVLNFFLSQDQTYLHPGLRNTWHWQRHD